MKKKTKISGLIWIAVAILFGVGACNDVQDCTGATGFSKLRVRFFDKASQTVARVNFDSVKAVGSDSLFYTQNDSLSTFDLELNHFSNSAIYIFYSGATIDTLSVAYSASTSVVSPECGPTLSFDALSLVKHTFDSTVLSNSFFDSSLEDNIQIYR